MLREGGGGNDNPLIEGGGGRDKPPSEGGGGGSDSPFIEGGGGRVKPPSEGGEGNDNPFIEGGEGSENPIIEGGGGSDKPPSEGGGGKVPSDGGGLKFVPREGGIGKFDNDEPKECGGGKFGRFEVIDVFKFTPRMVGGGGRFDKLLFNWGDVDKFRDGGGGKIFSFLTCNYPTTFNLNIWLMSVNFGKSLWGL